MNEIMPEELLRGLLRAKCYKLISAFVVLAIAILFAVGSWLYGDVVWMIFCGLACLLAGWGLFFYIRVFIWNHPFVATVFVLDGKELSIDFRGNRGWIIVYIVPLLKGAHIEVSQVGSDGVVIRQDVIHPFEEKTRGSAPLTLGIFKIQGQFEHISIKLNMKAGVGRLSSYNGVIQLLDRQKHEPSQSKGQSMGWYEPET